MSSAFFKSLPDWARLTEEIEMQMKARNDAARNAPDFAAKEYERGWYDALESVLALPDLILKGANGEEEAREKDAPEEEVMTVRVVPAPPARRMSGRF